MTKQLKNGRKFNATKTKELGGVKYYLDDYIWRTEKDLIDEKSEKQVNQDNLTKANAPTITKKVSNKKRTRRQDNSDDVQPTDSDTSGE